jgi:DNA phosphorothioation-associated putative methyltransferase
MTTIGKRVFDDLYLHASAVPLLRDAAQREQVIRAFTLFDELAEPCPNVAKLNLRTGKLSLLSYPGFDEEPFPELAASWRFADAADTTPVFRSYSNSINRPILHRKELLVADGYPRRKEWAALTATAESLGLFDDTTTIGFRLNWERLIQSKGYACTAEGLVPLGNDETSGLVEETPGTEAGIQRHLTALARSSLSAPMQLLIRHRLLTPEVSLFDYGCGRGDDLSLLNQEGFKATGWDPHFAPERPWIEADVVNLGFVVNVIEDPAERVEAITKAFALARGVLAASVMLHPTTLAGKPFGDGVLTSRQTFQKYFSQGEFKDYLDHILHRPVHMAGPGVAFVFASEEWEQRYSSGRYQTRGVAQRLLMARVLKRREATPRAPRAPKAPRPNKTELRFLEAKPYLDKLWEFSLDLGRWPDPEEVARLGPLPQVCATFFSAVRQIESRYDLALLRNAAETRADDLRVFFAAQQFQKRPPFHQLEPRLRRDVRTFFGDYQSAQAAGLCLLQETSNTEQLLKACQGAAEDGLGWLDADHSLQLHLDLVERLPALLRAYVNCGLVLWDAIGQVDLVKIHIGSGKLTLLEYDDFEKQPLPTLRRRVKINLRKLDYDMFEYGSPAYPKPLLYAKSRYLHEDQSGYAEQKAFDDAMEAAGLLPDDGPEPSVEALGQAMNLARYAVKGMRLVRSNVIPDLDQPCGQSFTYRQLIECGETRSRLGLRNLPLRPQTYNALHDLAVRVLDPVVEYFGAIKLTHGFCSSELSKHITKRVAHKLDQHASYELNANNRMICSRGGAACDFSVEDEDMEQVADWIIANLPFDRLYFYGSHRPLHVSYSERGEGKAYRLVVTEGGRLIPRPYG